MATELATSLQAYPIITLALIVLLSALESLLVIGLFIPGTAMLLGLGALTGAGNLPLWPTLAGATAGAMLGDTVSFLIGRYFRGGLPLTWPFRRYPRLWHSGQSYFNRQGGKAVLMGRYIGVMRPIVPAVAGATGMPVRRFLAVDAVACLTWVPLNMLPGVLLGTSFTLAAEVGGHLVMLVALLVGSVWLSFYLSRISFRYLWPTAESAIEAMLRWGERRRPLRGLAALLDPNRPELGGLILMTMLLTLAALATIGLLVWGAGGLPTVLDALARQLVDALRSPRVDSVALWLSYLGMWPVFALVMVTGGALFAIQGRGTTTWHWLAAPLPNATLAAALAGLLPVLPTHGPIDLPAHDHGAIAAAVYLFLATRIAAEQRGLLGYIAYSLIIAGVWLMLLARLYLGLEWPSVMLLELAVMGLWLAALEVAYRHHSRPARPVSGLLPAAVALAATVGMSYQVWQGYADDLAAVAADRAPPARSADMAQWWRQGWRRLPAVISGLQQSRATAFSLQWAQAPDELRRGLLAAGWRPATRLSGASLLRSLTDDPDISDLPVLPRVHDGRYPQLLMVRPLDTTTRQHLIYLWDSGVRAMPGGLPIWLGILVEQHRASLLGLLWYPRAVRTLAPDLQTVQSLPAGLEAQIRQRPGDDRQLLLLRSAPATGDVHGLTPAPPERQ